jgi:hypothetical protein
MFLEVCVCNLLRNVILQLVIRQRIVIRQLIMHEIQCSNDSLLHKIIYGPCFRPDRYNMIVAIKKGSFSVFGFGVFSCLAMTREGE